MKKAIKHTCLSVTAVLLFLFGLYGIYGSFYFALAPLTGSEPGFSSAYLAAWSILWFLVTVALFTGSVLAAQRLRRQRKTAEAQETNPESGTAPSQLGISIGFSSGSEISYSYQEIIQHTNRRLIPLLAVAISLPYFLVWGLPDIPSPYTVLAGIAIFFLAPLINIAPHELLHWIGWRIHGGVRWQDVQFGIRRKPFVAYIHSTVPMSARSYRLGLMLPGIVLGAIPIAIGIAINSGLTTLFGFVMLSVAGGDILILWKMHGIDGESRVYDQKDRPGVTLLPEGDTTVIEST